MNFTRGYETWEGEPIISSGELGSSCGMGHGLGCALMGVNFDTAGNPVQSFDLSGVDYRFDEDMGAYVFDLSGLGYVGYYYADNPNNPELSGFFKRLSRKVFRPIGRAVKKVGKVALPVLAIAGAPALGIGKHTVVGRMFGKGIAGGIFGKRGSGQASPLVATPEQKRQIQLLEQSLFSSLLAGFRKAGVPEAEAVALAQRQAAERARAQLGLPANFGGSVGTNPANAGNPSNAWANFLPSLVQGLRTGGQQAAQAVTGKVDAYVQQQLQALAQRQQALQGEILKAQVFGARETSRIESQQAVQAADAAARQAAAAEAEARRAKEAKTMKAADDERAKAILAAQRDKAVPAKMSTTTVVLIAVGILVAIFAMRKAKVI
jgi:hypothetical protein